jgi:LPXTG-motif cell wall-anchored protein
MKTLKRVICSLFFGIMNLPMLLKAQDEGTYLDNLGVQDSAYMEQELMTETGKGSGSGTLVVIIVIVVVILVGIVYYFMKKKKNKQKDSR